MGKTFGPTVCAGKNFGDTCCEANEARYFTEATSVKYLGCVLDNSVFGDDTAAKALKKITSRTKFLARKADLLDMATPKILAGALVLCHFYYSATVWYNSSLRSFKTKLQTAQDKLIRVVLKLYLKLVFCF